MSMTAKSCMSFLRGERDIVVGQVVSARRAGGDTAKLERVLEALEYAEATVFATREADKSGLKAGKAAGFVPYADR